MHQFPNSSELSYAAAEGSFKSEDNIGQSGMKYVLKFLAEAQWQRSWAPFPMWSYFQDRRRSLLGSGYQAFRDPGIIAPYLPVASGMPNTLTSINPHCLAFAASGNPGMVLG